MPSLPSLFLSHGSPDLPLHSSPFWTFLPQLGQALGRPRAILVVSAHWATAQPTISTAPEAKAIHDFGGFPERLYRLHYPAPGAPELADRGAQLLQSAGFTVATDPHRGLDHGAWVPLLGLYPKADIPITQLSIQPALGAAHHLRVGRALAPLLAEGVLILASGSTTHNLGAFGAYAFDAAPPDWVKDFDDWLKAAIAAHDLDALLNYRHRAPFARQNHPSEEHFLPLFVALGAGGDPPQSQQLHSSFTYGILSMASYGFAPTTTVLAPLAPCR